ncbi:MAG: FIVAR domain-containing protein [Firmicutes bacterium]|nr:FIVAR domain-containing protein [Bacillota bacterium]
MFTKTKKSFAKLFVFALAVAMIAATLSACISASESPDKTALQSAITSAEAIKSATTYSEYTQASRTAFENALDAAQTVNNKSNATQSEIDTAKNNLTTAQNALVKDQTPVAVDKTDLAAAISSAQAIIDDEDYENDYGELARGAFELVLSASVEVYDNANATQAQVDGATTSLLAAIELLTDNGGEEVAEVNKAELAAAIDDAQAIIDGEDYETDYAETDRETFELALAAAVEVFENDEATQAEVDEAVSDLLAAIDALTNDGGEEVAEVDKAELEAAISDAQAIIDGENYGTDYAEADREAFELALAAAVEVFENDEATQAEVDEAVSDLLVAIDALTGEGEE